MFDKSIECSLRELRNSDVCRDSTDACESAYAEAEPL